LFYFKVFLFILVETFVFIKELAGEIAVAESDCCCILQAGFNALTIYSSLLNFIWV